MSGRPGFSRRRLCALPLALPLALALSGCGAGVRGGWRGPPRETFGPIRTLGVISVLESRIRVIESEPLRRVPRERVLALPGWDLDRRAAAMARALLLERHPELTVLPLAYEPLEMRRVYPLPSERGFEFTDTDRIAPYLRRTFASGAFDAALLITRERLAPDFLRRGWYEGPTLYRPLSRSRMELPAVALRVRVVRSTTLSAKSGATALAPGTALVEPAWPDPLQADLGPRDWARLTAVFEPLVATALGQAIRELAI